MREIDRDLIDWVKKFHKMIADEIARNPNIIDLYYDSNDNINTSHL